MNVLRVIYDPYNKQFSNFVPLLQLESFHLQATTINALIRKNHDEKTSMFSTVMKELQSSSM